MSHMDYHQVKYRELKQIAEEASDTEQNINGACRAFCARLIAHIQHDSPAYAASIAGLLHMSCVLGEEEEQAA